MKLLKYEGKNIKITSKNGTVYTGIAVDYTPADENTSEKDSICIGEIEFFESDIEFIEIVS